MQHSTPALAYALALCVPLLASSAGLVVPPPESGARPPESRLGSLLTRLGSASLEERAEASLAMANDSAITLEQIERSIAESPSLSPEQLERLNQAGAARFANQPRAAMGVSFAWGEQSPDGVEISGTIGGFDSQRVLQAGDVIQSIGGVRLTSQPQTRAVIVSHSPGDKVTLRVIRQGEPIVIELALGDFAELNRNTPRGGMNQGFRDNSNRLDERTLRAAWDFRLARVVERSGRRPEQPLDPGLTDRQWAQIDLAAGNHRDQQASQRQAFAAQRIQNFGQGVRVQFGPNGIQVAQQAEVAQAENAVEAAPGVAVAPGGSHRTGVLSAPRGFSLLASTESQESSEQIFEALQRQEALIAQQDALFRVAGNLPAEVRARIQQDLAQLRRERSALKEKLLQHQQRMGGVQP